MNIVYNYVYTAHNKRIPLQEDIDLLELDHEVHISLGRELSFRSESMFRFREERLRRLGGLLVCLPGALRAVQAVQAGGLQRGPVLRHAGPQQRGSRLT